MITTIACTLIITLWLVIELAAAAVRSKHKDTDMQSEDIQFVVLVKGHEKYVFVYEDNRERRIDVQRTFGRFASNPELSFTWYDAAVLSQQVLSRAAARCNE